MCPPRHLQRRAVREARLRLGDDSHPGFADLIEVSFQRLDCAAVCLSSLLQLLERFLLPRQGRAQPILPTRDRAQHFLRGRDARRRRGLRGCAAFGGGPTRTLSPASRPCLARLLLARAWSLRRGTSGGPCCAAAGLGRGFVSHVGAISSFESSAVICRPLPCSDGVPRGDPINRPCATSAAACFALATACSASAAAHERRCSGAARGLGLCRVLFPDIVAGPVVGVGRR